MAVVRRRFADFPVDDTTRECPSEFVTPVEERKRPSSRTARYHLRQSSMLVLFPPVFDQRSESNLLKTSQKFSTLFETVYVRKSKFYPLQFLLKEF